MNVVPEVAACVSNKDDPNIACSSELNAITMEGDMIYR